MSEAIGRVIEAHPKEAAGVFLVALFLVCWAAVDIMNAKYDRD